MAILMVPVNRQSVLKKDDEDYKRNNTIKDKYGTRKKLQCCFIFLTRAYNSIGEYEYTQAIRK